MRPAGATNTKWSIGDVDRIARLSLSGMSTEQICADLEGTELESTPEEIEELVRDARRSNFYPPKSA
jgi:hypothetical protein